MLTSKELNTKIGGVRKSAAALRVNIQEILCSAAGHAYEHGDVTFYTRLIAATSGVNRVQIAKWISEYGFATMDKGGAFKLNKAARNGADFSNGDAVTDYLTDHATQWYEGEQTAKQIAAELDCAKRIERLAASIKKAHQNGETDVVIDTFATRKALRDLMETMDKIKHARDMFNTDAPADQPIEAMAIAAE